MAKTNPGRFFEDYSVGQVIDLASFGPASPTAIAALLLGAVVARRGLRRGRVAVGGGNVSMVSRRAVATAGGCMEKGGPDTVLGVVRLAPENVGQPTAFSPPIRNGVVDFVHATLLPVVVGVHGGRSSLVVCLANLKVVVVVGRSVEL